MSRLVPNNLSRTRHYICPRCTYRQIAQTSPKRALRTSSRRFRKHDSVLGLLEERGYVNQIAGQRDLLNDALRTQKVGIYAGVDPTAPSLHLGHLLPIMVLFWASLHGHEAVSLVGAATARVGDPSGRLTSRAETTESTQMSNAVEMFNQMFALWKNAKQYAKRHGYEGTEIQNFRVLENAKWLDQLNILDFLKTLGNGMRLGTMLGRDTVRNKMEQGDGMSFSEFTYPLLQAWDWWHMYSTMGVRIQVGGSDQYGNIVAGMDAVRYIAQTRDIAGGEMHLADSSDRLKNATYGLTVPLLTTASGEKFGKSAGNAIWLDPKLTSPFDLYGFLLRSSDADVERYLKLFTFVPTEDIETLMARHNVDPGKRLAQHLLASEVLDLVHGRDEALKTRAEHETSRNPNLASLTATNARASQGDQAEQKAGSHRIYLPTSLVHNTPLARVLYHAELVSTKSEGARLIAKGGVYVARKGPTTNSDELAWSQVKSQSVDDVKDFLIDGLLMVRIGKWKVRVIEIMDDDSFTSEGFHAPGWDEWRKRQSVS